MLSWGHVALLYIPCVFVLALFMFLVFRRGICAGLRKRRWVFSERDSAQAARVPPPLDIPESRAAMRIKLARE